jgi:hypothetical protein
LQNGTRNQPNMSDACLSQLGGVRIKLGQEMPIGAAGYGGGRRFVGCRIGLDMEEHCSRSNNEVARQLATLKVRTW